MKNNKLLCKLTKTTWEEVLDELRSLNENELNEALKTIGSLLNTVVEYVNYPSTVNYKGEMVPGWHYSLYIGGKCMCCIAEC